ncbi:hypothetical protein TNCV_4910861 [Trichonephila clavipes]|nr:hypothetical protein TNCV_4910861 [Trichonephila clavipes]
MDGTAKAAWLTELNQSRLYDNAFEQKGMSILGHQNLYTNEEEPLRRLELWNPKKSLLAKPVRTFLSIKLPMPPIGLDPNIGGFSNPRNNSLLHSNGEFRDNKP